MSMTFMAGLRRRAATRIAGDDGGVVAIEFAIVAVPALVILLFTMYIGILTFVSFILDSNVEKVAFQMYEGRPLCGGMTNTQFPYDQACIRQQICSNAVLVFVDEPGCEQRLLIDIRRVGEAGNATNIPVFVADDGGVDTSNFGLSAGIQRGEIVLVRAVLPFPGIYFIGGLPSLVDGVGNVIVSASGFRVRNIVPGVG